MLGARIASPHILRGEKAKCRRGTTPRGGEESWKRVKCEREERERREREKKHVDLSTSSHHLSLPLSELIFFVFTHRPSFFSLSLTRTWTLLLEEKKKSSDREQGAAREKEREERRKVSFPLSPPSLSLVPRTQRVVLKERLGKKKKTLSHSLFSLSRSLPR